MRFVPVSTESSLAGWTILTTRASGQGDELRRDLQALGATVVHIPTIEIVPPENWEAVDAAIGRLAEYDWLVFTSANAVDAFMDRAGTVPDVRIAVVGRQTARRLQARGTDADLIPDKFSAEGLLERFPTDLDGARILLPRAEVADETLPETLRSRGAAVDVVTVYRTRVPVDGRKELRRRLADRSIDCVTLTSGSMVHNLIEMLGPADASRLLAHPAIAVIGPVTRRAAEQAGLRVDIEPSSPTTPALVEAIQMYRVKK